MPERDPRRLAAWAAARPASSSCSRPGTSAARDPPATAAPPPVATIARRAAAAGGGRVVVDVAGAVQQPRRLPAAAERARRGRAPARGRRDATRADLSQINRAAKLEDGRQVLVPRARRARAAAGGRRGRGAGADARAEPLNLNTATLEQLDTLDGVGPATAQKILDYRTGARRLRLGRRARPGPGHRREAARRAARRTCGSERWPREPRRGRRGGRSRRCGVARGRIRATSSCGALVGGAAARAARAAARSLPVALVAAALGRGARALAALAAAAVLGGALVASARLAALDAGRARRACTGGPSRRARSCSSRVRERAVGPAVDARAAARRAGGGRAGGAAHRARTRHAGSWPEVGDERAACRPGRAAAGASTPISAGANAHAAVVAYACRADRRAARRARGRAGRRPPAGGARARAAGSRRPRRRCCAAWCSGEDERLAEASATDFQRSGLAHILAVSGQNVMLLVALVLAVCALPACRCARGCCSPRALVAVYVPLAGGGPSIQRAGVMGVAGLVAALAGRPARRWYALGLAAAARSRSTRAAPASRAGSCRSPRSRRCSGARRRLRAALGPPAARAGRRRGGDHRSRRRSARRR